MAVLVKAIHANPGRIRLQCSPIRRRMAGRNKRRHDKVVQHPLRTPAQPPIMYLLGSQLWR